VRRGDIGRRLSRLEAVKRPDLEDEHRHEEEHERSEFWKLELEHTALHLLRKAEPPFTLDERDRFLTLDGRFALSRNRMDLRALMGPLTEQIVESIPCERWGQFLAADEQAAELLEQLLGMTEGAEVPDTYRELSSIFADADEREAKRRLTWTLIHMPEARAMLSELTRRRDAFVAEGESKL
jgi:hypothetical protein